MSLPWFSTLSDNRAHDAIGSKPLPFVVISSAILL
jgi:hypothetical protein